MNQFRLVTMIARTTPETHNPRISAQTVTHHLREIGERLPYTMFVLYEVFLFWPSIYQTCSNLNLIYRKCSSYHALLIDIYPHAFLKKRQGYCNRLRPSVCPSVTLSPPKPLDEIQPNLVCELVK